MAGVSSVGTYASLDSMMGLAPTAASGSSGTGTLKSIWKFLQGDWGTSVGKAYKEAKTAAKAAGSSVSIFSFDWKKAYSDYHIKAAADAAEEAAKIASGELKKGFFGKMFGGLKRNLGPILTGIFFLPKIVKAFVNDGIGEGLKETAKAAISLTAFAIGSVIVGMLGLTGVLGFVAMLGIPMLTGMIADKGANMILGESKETQRELAAAQQKELQKTNPTNAQDIFKSDPIMASLKKRFDERNNYLGGISPQSFAGARTQYYA